ncbi:beta-microseminoprotein A1-like [Aquarana catesbeiana]|uniref:beta-microseminoprotein A1-like n=1 Tax=Aquarana catesbeiana TaxID=8400 RepID=UPI003CC9C662
MHRSYNSRTSPMVHVVCLILASGFLIMLCNATCTEIEPRRLSRGQILPGCMDGEITRKFNSTWFTEDCKECICHPGGSIDCCTEIAKPVFFDPECKAVLNQTSCKYEIKRTDSSSSACIIKGVM